MSSLLSLAIGEEPWTVKSVLFLLISKLLKLLKMHENRDMRKMKNLKQHQELLLNLRPDNLSDSYSIWFISPRAALQTTKT